MEVGRQHVDKWGVDPGVASGMRRRLMSLEEEVRRSAELHGGEAAWLLLLRVYISSTRPFGFVF